MSTFLSYQNSESFTGFRRQKLRLRASQQIGDIIDSIDRSIRETADEKEKEMLKSDSGHGMECLWLDGEKTAFCLLIRKIE
jgi:hypothetical protein